MRKSSSLLALSMNAIGASPEAVADRQKEVDVLLIGGGIMSATLGTYLQALEPDWTVTLVERLDQVAAESSNGWNNAGTGHAALAEMNYTPQNADGSVNIDKAVTINEAFQVSRQFWASLVQKGVLHNPRSFIQTTPHMSFVWGDENVDFLRKRYHALQKNSLFRGMEYSEDPQQIARWVPLVMKGRDAKQKVAATRTLMGTDVNFGEITRQLVAALCKHPQFSLKLRHDVRDITRLADGRWQVTLVDLNNGGAQQVIRAKQIFIGAGGAALPLLQKAGVPEAKGYAGFPVGGSFLVTENQEVVKRHLAKVYGKAAVGAPPMSVPHLDTRMLDGKQVLLFGPFATFSTRFLKSGSLLDMFGAMNGSNLLPMARVGIDNVDLVKYLVGQVLQTDEHRHQALQEYLPEARPEDWYLVKAGQRVQIIKKDEKKGGVLRLGTEVVASADGTISALLGASPGASTSAPIMIELMNKVFKTQMASPEWQAKLKTLIPSYGQKLSGNVAATEHVLATTSRILQLDYTLATLVANDEDSSTGAVVGK
ncbi:malate dehydrogenase (quinone) [Duffyella gerundensis]|jgi:malate dehydrogenase (quinone)|uniref:malate dehydrogenase (quinone) n=1 Tax=Duffyella gerundensis TaxID=1619313 RepID=UPI001CE2AB43|nr:malate dehydrogenase (quinone) [Duffyella gerundensis]UCB32689.1 malate dehydrogenase (quinone) [Duffyella gerundensis]